MELGVGLDEVYLQQVLRSRALGIHRGSLEEGHIALLESVVAQMGAIS